MKLGSLGFVAAVMLLIGAIGQPASASTIIVNPDPIDTFDVGKTKITAGGFDFSYAFTLLHAADLTYDIDSANITGLSVELRDSTNTLVSFTALAANAPYFFHVIGASLGSGLFAGTVTLTATPVPPALLLFLTALGGMGFAAYRHRTHPAV